MPGVAQLAVQVTKGDGILARNATLVSHDRDDTKIIRRSKRCLVLPKGIWNAGQRGFTLVHVVWCRYEAVTLALDFLLKPLQGDFVHHRSVHRSNI